MSLSEHDHLDLAAAEYALGTLEREYVLDFQQGLREDSEARVRLAEWEHRLAQLGLDLEPVEPPEHVWDAITREVGLAEHRETTVSRPQLSEPAPAAKPAPAANGTARARRWRRLAVAASLVAVVLAGLLIAGLPVWQNGGATANGPAYASLIHDQATGASWLVTSTDDGKKLSVDAMSDFKVPSDKMLRMWLKTPNGKPLLVGRLPHRRGHYTMKLSDALRSALGDNTKIVISMEDRSRAGTTTPSGKILWAVPLAHRTG